MIRKRFVTAAISVFLFASSLGAQTHERSRDIGIAFDGTPGVLDAITDVAGVEVGQTTLISGDGPLVVGKGPVRTGVTTILPRGRASTDPVFAAWFPLNGNGEMTGTTWVEESGFLEGPVSITNTHSVGVVRDALVKWMIRRPSAQPWALPVVAETYDGRLNDINGFHVKEEHVFAALDGARSGPVAEGNVGGGTGMVCFRFKGGIGTASRKLDAARGGYTVGVLVQCNTGSRPELRIAGAPVGQEIPDFLPCIDPKFAAAAPPGAGGPLCDRPVSFAPAPAFDRTDAMGSIIIVVATDAPLLPHQLKRLTKRAALGIGVVGGKGENPSGDIIIAFSTANPGAARDTARVNVEMASNDRISPLFTATVQATEEAIVNAMLAAETMTGANGVRVSALPHDRLREILRKYNRLKTVR